MQKSVFAHFSGPSYLFRLTEASEFSKPQSGQSTKASGTHDDYASAALSTSLNSNPLPPTASYLQVPARHEQHQLVAYPCELGDISTKRRWQEGTAPELSRPVSRSVLCCLLLWDFPRSYRDPPTRTYPSGTDPLARTWFGPDFDPISTWFGPEIALFRSESGRNRVEIGSESGPRTGRRGSGSGGSVPEGQVEVPVAPPESLYVTYLWDIVTGELRWAKSCESFAESLASVIAAIRITSVRWRSCLPPPPRNTEFGPRRPCVLCAAIQIARLASIHLAFGPSGSQEPRKGGFSKGGFCRVERDAQGNNKYPRILGPAVHLALRVAQPKEAYILQKPPSKNPLFLAIELHSCSEFGWIHLPALPRPLLILNPGCLFFSDLCLILSAFISSAREDMGTQSWGQIVFENSESSWCLWPVFSRPLPFCPLCWPPLFLPFFSAPFHPFLPLEKWSVL